ncbi:glycosyltransferase family 39 protein, partial [bacterium]|nr:glycosyltransferase family 39 protein [candidate division CSSED10-310 bacterium]
MRKTILHFITIFLISVFFRWIFLSGYTIKIDSYSLKNFMHDWPFGVFFFGDSWTLHHTALKLLETGNYGLPMQPPGTVFLLIAVYYFFDAKLFWGHLLFLILGALIPVIYGGLAQRWFGKRVGFLTAWLIAVSFNMIVLSGTICSEIPAIALLGLFLCCFYSKNKWVELFSGILLGFAILTRSELLIYAGILFLIFIFSKSVSIKKTILVYSLAILTVSPWIVRNVAYIQKHLPVLSDTHKHGLISLNGSL